MSVERPVILDIGGEGRNPGAWNVNRSRVRTCGPRRGEPIPRLIQARGNSLPFADQSVDQILVERTPLLTKLVDELRRVIKPGGTIVLRHVCPPNFDPHAVARAQLAPWVARQRTIHLGWQEVQETRFEALAQASIADQLVPLSNNSR